jgi:hypothetical protein
MNETPSPWKFVERSGLVQGESSTYGISAPAPYHWVVPPINIKPADAKLMAASKELFENLYDMLDDINSCGCISPLTLSKAKSLFEEITGRQP